MRPLALALPLLLCACSGDEQTTWTAACRDATPVREHARSAELIAVLDDALRADRGTGVSIAIMVDGQLVLREALGVAYGEESLTPAARMRIGSVSKLVTATAAARLAAHGNLDLDGSVADLVPEYEPGTVITPRQLATHTSGIRHYDFADFGEANNRTRYPDLTAALAVFADDPLLAPPGTAFSYSSFGYNLLGVAVERTTGQDFAASIRELVGTPLGLTGLALDDVEAAVPCRPAFHTVYFGVLPAPTLPRDNSDFYPSGGLLATAEDLARLADATFGAEVPDPLFTTPARLPDGTPIDYSFGWQIGRGPDGEVSWYGHGGHTNGAWTSLRYYPEGRIAVAAITNYNFWMTDRPPRFFEAVREEIPGLLSPDPAPSSD